MEIVACVGAEQDASLLINDADDPVAETVLDFLGDNILFDVGCHNAVDHTRSLIHHRLSHCDEVIADRAADNEAALMGGNQVVSLLPAMALYHVVSLWSSDLNE